MSHARPIRDAIKWQEDVSLLGQPTMVGNFLKIIVIAAGIMGALLVFMALATGGRGEMIVGLLELTGLSAGVIAALMLLVIIVFYRNRMSMEFCVDAEGAGANVIDRRASAGAKAALVIGVLAGKPQLAGVGVIASSSSSRSVAWNSVQKVRRSPRWRTIALANSWRTVLILYCDESNYDRVDKFVESSVEAASHLARSNPLPGLLLRTVLSIVATLPLFGLPSPVHVDSFTPLLVLCFALTTVWMLPIFGWVVIGALGWIAIEAIAEGSQPYTSSITGETGTNFGLLSTDGWVGIGVAVAGAAYLIAQSLALLTGRFESALASDMSESKPAVRHKVAAVPESPEPTALRFCTDCGTRLDPTGACPNCGEARPRSP